MATISVKSVIGFSVIGTIGAIDAIIIYCCSVMCGISVIVGIVLIVLLGCFFVVLVVLVLFYQLLACSYSLRHTGMCFSFTELKCVSVVWMNVPLRAFLC